MILEFIIKWSNTEKFLGKWIKSRDIEKNIVIISKVGEESSHPSEISSLLQISLERLNSNTVDILILHHHNKISINKYIDALNEIKFSGKIKIFGISNINKERFDESKMVKEK